MGPTGPRWAPGWPYEPWYLGSDCYQVSHHMTTSMMVWQNHGVSECLFILIDLIKMGSASPYLGSNNNLTAALADVSPSNFKFPFVEGIYILSVMYMVWDPPIALSSVSHISLCMLRNTYKCKYIGNSISCYWTILHWILYIIITYMYLINTVNIVTTGDLTTLEVRVLLDKV